MTATDLEQLVTLVRTTRWAALATCGNSGPIASQVAYAAAADLSVLWLHLSRLAAHTGALLDTRAAALSISEADDGRRDPQTLRRVALHCAVTPVDPGDAGWDGARRAYLERLPEAAPRFDFGDFVLLRCRVTEARWVGGFGRARTIGGEALVRVAAREAS